jgi:hypothetical protein
MIDIVLKPNEACNKVNLWVKENTNGLIEDVLSPTMVDDLTCLSHHCKCNILQRSMETTVSYF